MLALYGFPSEMKELTLGILKYIDLKFLFYSECPIHCKSNSSCCGKIFYTAANKTDTAFNIKFILIVFSIRNRINYNWSLRKNGDRKFYKKWSMNSANICSAWTKREP